MTADLVEEALRMLADGDEAPRPQFVEELRSRFVAEATGDAPAVRDETSGSAGTGRRSRTWFLAAAVLATTLAVFVVTIVQPSPPSASAAIAQARERFAALPPVRIVVERTMPAELLEPELGAPVADDWKLVTEISYLDETTWRREVTEDENDPFAPGGTVGNATVASGSELSQVDGATGTVTTDPLPDWSPEMGRLQALMELTPTFDQAAPALDEALQTCRVDDGEERLGRAAAHFRCAVEGEEGEADLWLDDGTGIVLLLSLPNGVRFEVRSLEVDPEFPADTFTVEAGGESTSPEATAPATGVALGDEVAPWSLPLAGRDGDLDLSALRGRHVIVYVWATWCGTTCYGGRDDQLQALDEVQARDADGLAVVSLAWGDDPGAVSEVLAEIGLAVPTGVAQDVELDLPEGLWRTLAGVPGLVVLDEDGRLVALYAGDLQGDDIRAVAAAVLAGDRPPDLGGQTSQLLE